MELVLFCCLHLTTPPLTSIVLIHCWYKWDGMLYKCFASNPCRASKRNHNFLTKKKNGQRKINVEVFGYLRATGTLLCVWQLFLSQTGSFKHLYPYCYSLFYVLLSPSLSSSFVSSFKSVIMNNCLPSLSSSLCRFHAFISCCLVLAFFIFQSFIPPQTVSLSIVIAVVDVHSEEVWQLTHLHVIKSITIHSKAVLESSYEDCFLQF